ncbi:MAG: hypothetical protein HYS23_03480 [Geobacter sp.]|nr:hypothetical protein [Geobacter sp.]
MKVLIRLGFVYVLGVQLCWAQETGNPANKNMEMPIEYPRMQRAPQLPPGDGEDTMMPKEDPEDKEHTRCR